MSDKCPECPVPSADMDGFIVSGPGGAPRSESDGVSAAEGPFVREAPQTGHFILKGKVSPSSPLPDVPEVGWTYEAAEAGTYGGVQVPAGGLVYCSSLNPVEWKIMTGGSDVSVAQVLHSGTKIATVTVDGQATDLFCTSGGGIQTLSGDFGCETREISPAVDEPAVFYSTKIVYLDQTGYEALQAGHRPSSGHYEYAVEYGTIVHESSSFTTLAPESESSIQNPYAIALSTGLVQNRFDYQTDGPLVMDWSYGGGVLISDLLAAGEDGVKLAHIGENTYGDGTLDVYASLSANQDGSYTVSYSARKDAVTEDVLTAKIDGKDGSGETVSSVDVSPLLNYIGGKVEEVRSQEQVPLVDTRGLNPSDAVFPVYFNSLFDPFVDANDVGISTSSYSVSDGSEIFVLPSGSNPVYFYPRYTRFDSVSFSPVYYYFVPESEGSASNTSVSLNDLLSGPVELQEYTAVNQQSVPSPTGNTVTLVMEAVEGDAPTYRCSLYAAGGEAKKVLRLHPSCDGDIDLSGLDVSVEQVLSSGTKIATVTVGDRSTDLFCTSGGGSAGELSFECGAAASPVSVSSDISAGMFASPSPLTPPFPDAYAYPLTTSGNTFTIKGSEFNTYASRAGSTGEFHLIVKDGGEGYYFHTPCNVMAYFFSGAHGIGVGTVRQFIGSSRGFLLESRTELTSEDPGGPDIVCVFRFVECGGDRLTLGDQIANLSCIAEHAGPGDYSKAYSWTSSSGDAAPHEFDLSAVVNDADGFYDVLVAVRVSNYTSISVKSDGFTTVTLDCSAVSSGSPVQGVVRFWNDGNLRRYSYGTVSSPSAYTTYSIPLTEVSLFNAFTPLYRYVSSKITISPPSGSTFTSSVSVGVFVRRPHSAV